MKFPPSLLEEIRARLPVSAVVGRRVKLTKAGREYRGLSPFNAEKSPSFFVNDQKGFYHDFSSGKHGDIFTFLMETEGLASPEAVERLASEAGVAMPEIGVYESEEVNAFATGPTRNNALVAVSSGLIHNMSPRQIEGVLAHEMSHIANGDMVTMTLLQGVLNTFVVFFSKIIGFAIDQALRRNDDERSGPGWGYAIGSLVAQIVLGIFASMIVMAYSRHREFRADAMAAQLEGKDAMIGALQRLQQIMGGGGVLDDRSAAVSAFKINNHSDGLMALFASHPPLEARIAALDGKSPKTTQFDAIAARQSMSNFIKDRVHNVFDISQIEMGIAFSDALDEFRLDHF